MIRASSLQAFTNGILVICLCLSTGLFLWSADKGFDFTDEGLYLHVYQHPEEFPDVYTSYHRVGAVVFRALSYSIPAIRITGFLLTLLATVYFAVCLLDFLTYSGGDFFQTRAAKTGFILLILLSLVAGYSWLPATPNYNTMAGIGLLLTLGGILRILIPPKSWRSWLVVGVSLILMGFGLLLAFLAKGSSAIGIALISGILLMLCNLIPWKRKLLFGSVAIAAIFLVGAGVFFFMPELLVSWQFLITVLTKGDGARDIVIRHAQESIEFAIRNWKSYHIVYLTGLLVVIFARTKFLSEKPVKKETLIVMGVCIALAVELFFAFQKHAFLAGIKYRSGSMLGYSSLLILLLILKIGLPRLKFSPAPVSLIGMLVFLLWLSLLPFVTAAGTTHIIYINALIHLAPFLAAIGILAAWLDLSLVKPITLPLVSLFVAALTFSQFLSGFIYNPYRTVSKMKQTEEVAVGVPASVLQLDVGSKNLLEDTRAALAKAGFQPGDDILVFHDLPGLVYALGGISPERPWYFSAEGAAEDLNNVNAIKRIAPARLQRAFVVITNDWPHTRTPLAAAGHPFPDTYHKIFQTKFPPNTPSKLQTLEIWAPNSRSLTK